MVLEKCNLICLMEEMMNTMVQVWLIYLKY